MAVMQFEIVCVHDQLQRFSFNFVQKKSNCSEDLIMFCTCICIHTASRVSLSSCSVRTFGTVPSARRECIRSQRAVRACACPWKGVCVWIIVCDCVRRYVCVSLCVSVGDRCWLIQSDDCETGCKLNVGEVCLFAKCSVPDEYLMPVDLARLDPVGLRYIRG